MADSSLANITQQIESLAVRRLSKFRRKLGRQ